MIENDRQLRVTVEQMGRVLRGLEDSTQTVLKENPELYGVMVEAYIDDLMRMRDEVEIYLAGLEADDGAAHVRHSQAG